MPPNKPPNNFLEMTTLKSLIAIMTQEQLLLELFNGLLEVQAQMHDIFEMISTNSQHSAFEIWAPVATQVALVFIGLATLVYIHNENKRNAYLPYMKILHDEMNDIILSLYHLLENPQWSITSNEAWEANYKNSYEGFLQGHRYFVRSSIRTDREAISRIVNNVGRRKMYFNELKNRYVTIYEALLVATKKADTTKPLHGYFEMTEYKTLYEAYKDMEDIS